MYHGKAFNSDKWLDTVEYLFYFTGPTIVEEDFSCIAIFGL